MNRHLALLADIACAAAEVAVLLMIAGPRLVLAKVTS